MQNSRSRDKLQPGLGAMEIACNAMEIAAKQTLCEDEASVEAMEIATDPMESALG